MSRRRLSPTEWLDEGPASVVIRHGNGIEAEPIGYMKPILTHHVVLENRSRVKAPQAFSIHPENRRQVCGLPMMRKFPNWQEPTGSKFPNWQEPTGSTCGRIVGHADTHRSRETMAAEAARRRTGHRRS